MQHPKIHYINLLLKQMVRVALLGLIGLMIIVVARGLYLNITTSGLEVDAGLFAEGARLQLNGQLLYVDLIDNKPPGVFLYLVPFVALFGTTNFAINLGTMLLNAALGIIAGLLVLRLTRSPLSAVMASLATGIIAVTSPKPETTTLMAVFSGLTVLLLHLGAGRIGPTVAAGAAFALGILTKQPLLFELPAFLLFLLHVNMQRGRVRALVMFCIGSGLVGTIFTVGLLGTDSFSAFWENTVSSVGHYVFSSDSNSRFNEEAFQLFKDIFLGRTVPLFRSLALFGMFSVLVYWRSKSNRGLLYFALLWVLCGLVASATGRALKPAYFYQALPALALLAALAIPLYLRFHPILQLLLIWGVGTSVLFVQQRFINPIDPATFPGWVQEDHELIEFLKNNTESDDCLWTWGYLNSFNYWANRRACAGAPFDGYLMLDSMFPIRENRNHYIQQMLERRPALLLHSSPWGYFPALRTYAERYRGDVIYERGHYEVYAVDRSMWHEADANFGNEIRFIGYDLLPVDGPYCAGDTLTLAMTWQQISRPTHQYQMFVQLLTPDETARAAGYDGPPEDGNDRNATNTWVDTGEIRLGERFDMAVPADTAPGNYKLIVGLYDVVTAERLPVVDANGTPVADYAHLQGIDVQDCANDPESDSADE
jgi:hypothetical protein